MEKRKILIQRVTSGSPDSGPAKVYWDLLNRNADIVKDENTEITVRMLRRGLNSLTELAYSSLHYMNDREVFEAVLTAEKDGFEAVIVCCFSDPALDEMRQAVDIPVIGLGQSAMMAAGLMGARFGLVAMSNASIARNELLAMRYGCHDKIVKPILTIPLSLEEQGKAILGASKALAAFKNVAKRYVDDGAEVLIAACGNLNLALRFCPGCEEHPDGITEFEGAAIIDGIGAAVKLAEMMVDLRRAGSAWISRNGMYCRPSREVTEEAVKKLAYSFGGVV